jgi:hypothetical protein
MNGWRLPASRSLTDVVAGLYCDAGAAGIFPGPGTRE